MRAALFAAAASLAAIGITASAGSAEARDIGPAQTGSGVHVSFGHGDDFDDDDRRRPRRDKTVVIGNLGWSDDWAYYNNRSFDPDSFNGWWHDRPDRSYPRWLQGNSNCERLWWSGAGWRC